MLKKIKVKTLVPKSKNSKILATRQFSTSNFNFSQENQPPKNVTSFLKNNKVMILMKEYGKVALYYWVVLYVGGYALILLICFAFKLHENEWLQTKLKEIFKDKIEFNPKYITYITALGINELVEPARIVVLASTIKMFAKLIKK